jgi:hypothetical protein
MHAERYSFNSCEIKEIDIDICYIFGYMFFDTNINGINIIYMGDRVEFSKNNMLNRFASKLWAQRRYHEFINANIIFDNLEHIPQLVKSAFIELADNTDYTRQLQGLGIFEVLQFYTMNNCFDFVAVRDINEFFDEFDWMKFEFDDKLLFLAHIQKFKLYIGETAYNDKFIDSAKEDIAFVTFYCGTDDYEYALSSIKDCLNEICSTFGINSKYEVIEWRKGSWIITVVVIASAALILPKIFKKYADVIIEVNTKRKISKRIADRLERKNLNLSDLKLITDIAKSVGIVAASSDEKFDLIDVTDMARMLEVIKIGI